MVTRLSRLKPGAALGTGIALGIGGPKRLGLTLIVAATISAAALGSAEELSLVAIYVLVATALVWVPVALYVLFGTRATDWIADAQLWVSAHQQPLTFYPSLVVGRGTDGRRAVSPALTSRTRAQDAARTRAGVDAVAPNDLAVDDERDVALGVDDETAASRGEVLHPAGRAGGEPRRIPDHEVGDRTGSDHAAVAQAVERRRDRAQPRDGDSSGSASGTYSVSSRVV